MVKGIEKVFSTINYTLYNIKLLNNGIMDAELRKCVKIIRIVVLKAKGAKGFADERNATQLYMSTISVIDFGEF